MAARASPEPAGRPRRPWSSCCWPSFDEVEAERIGVVNRALPPGELAVTATAWTRRLAAGPPIALRLGKHNLRAAAASGGLADALQREEDAQLQCLRSRDALVGVQAFFLKKEPQFEGR
ncbi:MAG: enoyl-CoA hydratase-related protein [Myxococcota bacterium]